VEARPCASAAAAAPAAAAAAAAAGALAAAAAAPKFVESTDPLLAAVAEVSHMLLPT
jgi:hypothetical protein